ncbi:hypothetical protein E1211_17905 [Micromonospora sp. 15K316]|uniref:hypothetical protein n=1 Tax=Micromonospora sp. 15K316 TaxID=2530376 RepID=UPI0010499FD0|nr:hypothetical protein [Micromonospora sp. 15K316]TDC34222.1 hypothetical protein E1211_17905 [Micromonospora sp. 15K316]
MTGRSARWCRVGGYVAGLVLAFGIVLLGLELAAPGAGPDVALGAWRMPVAVPLMVVAALAFMWCSRVVRRVPDDGQ